MVLERLEALPVGRFHYKLLGVTGLGWLFDSMDTGLIAFILPVLAKDWNLLPGQMGMIGSIGLIGMALGAVVSGTIAADELSADASTIYLISFSPDDKVRDPSLRDGFLFTKPVLGFGFEESRGGFGMLEASLNGSFAFGFPKVRESRMIPMWSFDSLKFKGSVSELNPQALLKASSKAPSRDKEGTENDAGKAALEAAFAAVSSPLKLRLEDFSFSHEGSEVKLSGLAQAQLDRKALKPQSVRAEINAAASREFVRKLAEDGYEDEFAQRRELGGNTGR